uniref:Uncharacterized protein n=1 Tax=Arundo donax TaxID=35708 RepID=A0A0A8YSE0_ARUDO
MARRRRRRLCGTRVGLTAERCGHARLHATLVSHKMPTG